VTGPNFFGRVFRIKGEKVPLIIKQHEAGHPLEISFTADSVNGRDIRSLSRRILGLDISLDSALLKIEHDPKLKQIGNSVKGIRPYLAESLHEAIVKSIIQQQISYRSANVVTRRMILSLSRKRVFNNVELYAFPSPARIVDCGLDGLGEFGIGYRTEYVHRISSLVASGDLDLKSLEGGSFAEVMEVLGSIRGIGEWTVKVAMIAGFGDLTVFPYDDLSIQNILGMIYNKGARMTKNQVIKKSEEWGKEGPSILYLLMSAYVLGLTEFQGTPKTHKR
jgi:DNA-3-methyladenine glycosylase II